VIRFLPFAIEFALLVFCVIDIIQTPDFATRNLSKGWWLVLVIVLPLIGCVAWLVAGRPQRERSATTWSPGAGFPEVARPPVDTNDVDRALREELDRIDREYDELLRHREGEAQTREAELRAREAELDRRERELREGPESG
jgi:hypothetical protein